MKIFISYRHADSAPYGDRVRDALAAHFFDAKSIEVGAAFADAVAGTMALTDVIIVVMGPNWLTASWPDGARRLEDPGDVLRNEIRVAIDRELNIIPVLVNGATMPRAEELPDAIKLLAGRNALRLSDEQWADDVRRLVSAIERLVTRGRGSWNPEIAQAVDAIQRQNYAAAVDLLSRELADHPTADGYYHRGLAYFYQTNFRLAAADFEQAVSLAPESAMAHRQRGKRTFQLR
jgi:tetratricopeptide (TPR) repeat protein